MKLPRLIFIRGLAVACALLVLTACQAQKIPPAPFHAEKLAEIDATIEKAVAEKKTPGGVFWLERAGAVYQRAYGQRAVEPKPEPMTVDTIFDTASLTKVLATTPAILLLVERGQIKLDARVSTYLPKFLGDGKDDLTIRHLLTHSSGLRPGLNPRPESYAGAIQMACEEKVTDKPGVVFRYSDINFIVLGEVARLVAGEGLEEFVLREIYRPLKMNDTRYLPPADWRPRLAPTERGEAGMLLGVVHDPTARRMGGVAGHAGVFSTAADLARFARMMLNGGELEGVRIFKAETVALMTAVQSPPELKTRHGLGWDIDSDYTRLRGKLFPIGSYGHTGWTGTSIWIDPFSKTFWIFLSNRNHPGGQGNILAVRSALGTLAAEAVTGFDFSNVPGALPPK